MHKQLIRFSTVGFTFLVLLSIALYSWRTKQVEIPDNIKNQPTYQDQGLLQEALALPVAVKFRDKFEYQINWAFCGPAAAVNVFISVGIDTYTQDTVFDNSRISYWKARFLGLTLDEMSELIADNSSFRVDTLRGLSRGDFHQHLQRSNNPNYRYIINFNRFPLFGVEIGHHSPIGGYLAKRDLVLVLDVLNEYKPFLVPSNRLYDAMNTIDSETGKTRGLIRVHISEEVSTSQ